MKDKEVKEKVSSAVFDMGHLACFRSPFLLLSFVVILGSGLTGLSMTQATNRGGPAATVCCPGASGAAITSGCCSAAAPPAATPRAAYCRTVPACTAAANSSMLVCVPASGTAPAASIAVNWNERADTQKKKKRRDSWSGTLCPPNRCPDLELWTPHKSAWQRHGGFVQCRWPASMAIAWPLHAIGLAFLT